MDLYCIQINRGNDGSISSAVLTNGVGSSEVFKDEIKQKLSSGVWKIDRLYLSSDGKLLERPKDTLISDYEESCKNLGIEPLKIEKKNNDYIIKDFPRNCKNIIIPDFVSGIQMSKRIGISGGQNQNMNSNLNTGINLVSNDKQEAYRKIGDIHTLLQSHYNTEKGVNVDFKKDLTDIKSVLNEMKTDNLSSDNQINQQLADINDLINDVKTKQLNDDLLNKVQDLKTQISDHGQRVLELKQDMSSFTTNFTDKFDTEMDKLNNKPSEATNFNILPAYLRASESSSCFLSEDKYNDLENGNSNLNIDPINLIPYVNLSYLKDMVDYYYNVYTAMDSVFCGLSNQEKNELAEFQNGCNTINNTINSMDKISFIPPVKFAVDTANWAKSLSVSIADSENYKRACRKFGKVYKEANELLKDFSCDTDEDILTFLVEYRVLFRNSNDGIGADIPMKNNLLNKKSNITFKYKKFLRVIYDNLHSSDVHFSDEVIKRLAVAYILAQKIINGNSVFAIPLNITPNRYTWESDEIKTYTQNSIGKIESVKYQSLLYSIQLNLMYSILIIEGFDIRFIDKYFKRVKQLEHYYDIIKLEKSDLRNLNFDFDVYKNNINITARYI